MDKDEAEHEVGEMVDEVAELLGDGSTVSLRIEWCDAGCLEVVASSEDDGDFGIMEARDFEKLAEELEGTAPELRVMTLRCAMASF